MPDDIGYPQSHPDKKGPRARQNVIFELGFFTARLGLKVCALHSGDVEILSDYQGVVYVSMDAAVAWKFAVAKEIKQAGIDVDLNNVI